LVIKEHIDLDKLVDTYNIDTVTEHYKRLEFLQKLSQHVRLADARVLELGSASGRLTEMLAAHCPRVVAVDGSARFLETARARPGNQGVEFVHSMFEDLALSSTFDVIVMHHVLEHIQAPWAVLGALRKLLTPGGLLAITVPNAAALSRQLAVKMGVLKSVFELTENDHRHGHFRVYDYEGLAKELLACGYSIAGRHGLSFKLFADFQNEQMFKQNIIGDAQLRGLWQLAEEYPEVAGAIMVLASRAPEYP
jgi:2-polyprenyl-3-methyl-5-hydroxy-6-metoxy-1,4-benzoquinol methylase